MLSISTCKNQSSEIYSALYIPIYEYNYKVITRCDKILQEYYITDRHKCENTKRYTSKNRIKGAHKLQRENSRDEQGAWRIGPQTDCRWSTLSLRIFDQQLGEFTSSKLWDLDLRIQGSQNNPTSGVANAEWHAGISTCVSINLNQKSMYWKSCREYRHTGEGRDMANNNKQRTCMV